MTSDDFSPHFFERLHDKVAVPVAEKARPACRSGGATGRRIPRPIPPDLARPRQSTSPSLLVRLRTPNVLKGNHAVPHCALFLWSTAGSWWMRRLDVQGESPPSSTRHCTTRIPVRFSAMSPGRLVKLAGWDPDACLSDDIWPLRVAVLRGGMYRDDTWADSPAQPLICASTVDQVGSRLLFRGYGLGRSGRLTHAGLVGNDSLILVDEAHLSRPFLTTTQAIEALRKPNQPGWGPLAPQLPFQVVPMSATPGGQIRPFGLSKDDRSNKTLQKRLAASKIARVDDEVPTGKDAETINPDKLATRLAEHAVTLSKNAVKSKSTQYIPRVVGIVVNRVDTARRTFNILKDDKENRREVILLTGRVRPIDRDRLLRDYLKRLQAGRNRPGRPGGAPLFVVATQTIECGADLDLDALVTEVAPLDALRQRFGRVDRLGELRLSEFRDRGKESIERQSPRTLTTLSTAKPPRTTWKWLRE